MEKSRCFTPPLCPSASFFGHLDVQFSGNESQKRLRLGIFICPFFAVALYFLSFFFFISFTEEKGYSDYIARDYSCDYIYEYS